MRRIKLIDIAQEARVSVATVTRCLNQSGYVSKETALKVKMAAQKLGYFPNFAAQALRGKVSHLVGHIVPTAYNNPYFALLCEEVNRVAFSMGYHVVTMVITDVQRELIGLMEQMRARGVDGILLSSFMQTEITSEVVAYLEQFPLPLVMVERSAECFGIDKVQINNSEGTYLAVRHLLEMGHSDIAYLGKKLEFRVEQERFRGYLMGLGKQENQIRKDRIYFVDEYDTVLGFEAAKELCHAGSLPSAILIASDILAAGALHYFLSHGIRIPQDLSIVGHDDTVSQYLSPPLTTVCLPLRDMAKCALELVLHPENTGREIAVSPHLVTRSSVLKRIDL